MPSLGEASLSEKREPGSGKTRSYAVVKPREAATFAGMPNSLIATCPVVSGCVLRAGRLVQERRERARCARERIAFAVGGEAAGGDKLTSRRWFRTSRMQARRYSLRLQSCQSSGEGPTTSGCSSTLTWRGFAVKLPFHWHCSRSGQGRQLWMLAPYTTRRLPSTSRLCS